jgi:hypothetical protein
MLKNDVVSYMVVQKLQLPFRKDPMVYSAGYPNHKPC